jgi:thioredoxin reductase
MLRSTVYEKATITRLNGTDGKLSSVSFDMNDCTYGINVDYVNISIGRTPNTQFLVGSGVKLDEKQDMC